MNTKTHFPDPHTLTSADLYNARSGLSNSCALSHYVRIIHVLLPIYEKIRLEVEDPLDKKKKLANVVLHPLRDAVRKASCQVTIFSESGSLKNAAMYISDNAAAKLKENGIKPWPRNWPTGFVAEHVIPVSVLLDNIIVCAQEGTFRTEKTLTDFFLAYSHIAVVTDAEDSKLRTSSCHQLMPKPFTCLNQCKSEQIFARYLKCGISLNERGAPDRG